MKIAQIAPIIERVPPKKYGGTERVVHALTEELVRRGHEVTLFASGDSLTTAKLKSVIPRGLREARIKDLYGLNPSTLQNIGIAYEQHKDFDIIHDHVIPASLPTANISPTPVVATMHGPFTHENKRLFETLKRPGIVSISQSQAEPVPHINHLGTVYNGLPMEQYPYRTISDDYLLFVGRISPEKGTHIAIQVAQALDMPLILSAKLEKTDEVYFKEYVEPHLSDRIQWINEVDEAARNRLMSKARAFLHPAMWREPFGLTIIEAMACGCPVVALDKGSIPEIILSGITGFVAHDIEEMIESVAQIIQINRVTTREYALEFFSAKRMTDGYLAMYEKKLSSRVNIMKEDLFRIM